MDPRFSRRGWFRGVFAALFGWWARPAANAGRAAAPGAWQAGPLPFTGATYWTGWSGPTTTTVVYDASCGLPRVEGLDLVITVVYEATWSHG